MRNLEFCISTEIWLDILERSHKTSLTLQAATIDLIVCCNLYKSLIAYFSSMRNDFLIYEEKGKALSKSNEYKESTSRPKRKKLMFDENDTEVILTPGDKFRTQVYYKILDQIVSDLKQRSASYTKITDLFLFLFKLEKKNRK